MAQGFTKGLQIPVPVNQGGTGTTTSTGIGSVVLSNTPTLVDPILGAATATSLAFNPISGGIIGVTTTSPKASAGFVGEYLTADLPSGSAISLTTAMPVSVIFLPLTAGVWQLSGGIAFAPGATTNITNLRYAFSSTPASIPTTATLNNLTLILPQASIVTGGSAFILQAPIGRLLLNAGATIHLNAQASFSVSSMVVYGWIGAERIR